MSKSGDDSLQSLIWPDLITRWLALLGTDEFGSAISTYIRDHEAVDFVVVNLHDPSYKLDSRIGELTPEQRKVASLADRHSTFRFDPNSELLQQLRNSPRDFLQNRVRFDDISRKRYQNLFFERFQLVDRLSVISPKKNHWVVTSFYRTAATGEFSDDDCSHLVQMGQLINSLTLRHLDLLHIQELRSQNPDLVAHALTRSTPLLSTRERQVCARLIIGFTNAETADSLGIGLESVRTLRRRARDKVGTSNMASLAQLAMQWVG